MAAEPRHGQHLLTMSDIATRLGTTTTGQLLVRSGIEIERLLNAMVRDSAPVTGKLPDLMFLSRVLHFDPAAQHVVMAFTDHKPANSAVLATRSDRTMSDIATRLGTTTTGQLLVRSGIEIERLLNAMVRDSAPVTGKLPDLMFLSRVLHFDPAAQHVVMAFTDHKPANSAVLATR